MSLLQQGFREIGRKFRRLALRRRIKAAATVRADALRALGRRAVETGATGSASEGLLAGLAETEAKDQQLAARLYAIAEKTQALEKERDADAARFAALAKEVTERKSPVDAELATQQKAATHHQRETEDGRRRLAKANAERQSLEVALRQPTAADHAAFDRAQAEARLAALLAEQPNLEALQIQRAQAHALAIQEIERLNVAIAPLEAELDQIARERKQASESAKRALAEQRKEADQVRADVAGVSRRRDKHFEELGQALAAATTDAPALAAEKSAVEAAETAQAALQNQYDGSLADSGAMPKGTMAKFSALMAAAALAMGGATYAATQAMKAQTPTQPVEEDCSRMTYDVERPPVKAHPGGPYTVVRGNQVTLDGSQSKGRCLTYTWTFSPAPKDAADRPGHSSAGSSEDAAVFAAVDKLACPEGTSGNPGARKHGRQAPASFLCSLTVTLTVTDGRSTDSEDVLVKVKPRGGWKTSIDQKQTDGFLADAKLVRGALGLHLGANVCALDTTGGHALHAGKSWQGEGYRLTSITDPDGPFDGWWYLGSSALKIKRAVQINPDLAASSELYQKNIASGYPDIAVLRASVLEHERLHGKLIFEKMQKIQQQGNDPAKIIETLSAPEEEQDTLVEWTDIAIAQIEGHLYPPQGSAEYLQNHAEIKSRLAHNPQFGRGGTVLLPDTDGNNAPYPIPSFAGAGDDAE